MASLEKEAVEHLARLARLKFSEAELLDIRGDLEQILGHVDELQALNTTDVLPTSHGVELAGKFRKDIRGEGLSRDRALEQAPENLGEGFGVPKVIDA